MDILSVHVMMLQGRGWSGSCGHDRDSVVPGKSGMGLQAKDVKVGTKQHVFVPHMWPVVRYKTNLQFNCVPVVQVPARCILYASKLVWSLLSWENVPLDIQGWNDSGFVWQSLPHICVRPLCPKFYQQPVYVMVDWFFIIDATSKLICLSLLVGILTCVMSPNSTKSFERTSQKLSALVVHLESETEFMSEVVISNPWPHSKLVQDLFYAFPQEWFMWINIA